MRVLGIETSCDETAVAVVDAPAGDRPIGRILANVIYSQLTEHRRFGGVVPEIAARAHLERLDGLVAEALATAGVGFGDLDGIAATGGPGLIGGVMVGVMTAKAIAFAHDKPFLAINHLEGHALSARLTEEVAFPYLLLLVSGGHCQLVGVGGADDFRVYGGTIDDAVGEAFDKTAKLLGLPYPGGPAVEKCAQKGNPRAYDLPRPLLNRRTDGRGDKRNEGRADFSFSGLKTAVRQLVQGPVNIDDISASFQAAVIDILCDRSRLAMAMFSRDFPAAKNFVVAGGVAANQAIGRALTGLSEEEGFLTHIPPPRLCTDNAAMIAWAGIERLSDNIRGDALSVSPRARWPLGVVPARFEPNT